MQNRNLLFWVFFFLKLLVWMNDYHHIGACGETEDEILTLFEASEKVAIGFSGARSLPGL